MAAILKFWEMIFPRQVNLGSVGYFVIESSEKTELAFSPKVRDNCCLTIIWIKNSIHEICVTIGWGKHWGNWLDSVLSWHSETFRKSIEIYDGQRSGYITQFSRRDSLKCHYGLWKGKKITCRTTSSCNKRFLKRIEVNKLLETDQVGPQAMSPTSSFRQESDYDASSFTLCSDGNCFSKGF